MKGSYTVIFTLLLLGALGATLFIISTMGWAKPPVEDAEILTLAIEGDQLQEYKVAA